VSANTTSSELGRDVSSKSFPAGKPENKAPVASANPTAIVHDFVHHRSTSIKEDISAGVALSQGINAVRGDKTKSQQFLAALNKAKALSKKEKQLGLYAPKTAVSMYAKIANYADILLDEKVLSMLSTGYTTLYQAANLYEDIDGTGEPNAAERFRDILSSSDGPITKRFLINEREKINGKPRSEPAQQSAAGAGVAGEDLLQSEPVANECSEPGNETPFSALLVSLKTADTQKLAKSYPGELPFCLRVHELRGDNALLLVHARLKDLIGVADKLPCWGFARFEHVYLLSSPQQPDAFDADVLGISRWGNSKMNLIESWPDHSDALALADTLLADIGGRKLHLFASDQRDGWVSVVGDKNWAVANSDE
jgi:hypothetical protein